MRLADGRLSGIAPASGSARSTPIVVIALSAALATLLPTAPTAQTPPDTTRLLGDSAAQIYQRAEGLYQDRASHADLDSALVLYRQAAPLYRRAGERRGEARSLDRIGLIQRRLGYTDSALVSHRHALAVSRESGDRSTEAAILTNLSVAYRIVGNHDSALAMARAALSINRAAGDRARQASTLTSIGNIYRILRLNDSSLTYLQAALQLFRELGNRQSEAGALNNIGIVQDNRGEPDSALTYYRQALVVRREVRDRLGEARTLNNIGNIQEQKDQRDSALGYYTQALAIVREFDDRVMLPGLLQNIGVIHEGLKQYDSALVYYRAALAGHRTTAERGAEAVALHNLGLLYYNMAQGRADAASLRRAVAHYDSALAVHAAVAATAGSDFNRVAWFEQSVRFIEHWTYAWLARDAELGPRAAALGALAAAERGRAQALLNLMRTTRQEGGGLAEIARTQLPGADLVAEGAALGDGLARDGVGALVFLADRDSLVTWLLLPSGEVSVSRHPVGRDSLAGLVAALRAGLGVDQAALGLQLALRGAPPLEPSASTRAYRRGLRYAERAAHALAQFLLPSDLFQRLGRVREIVVVPQGPLALVPFALLPVTVAGEPLSSRIAVRYVPSLSVLRAAHARATMAEVNPKSALRRALVVGNPTMPRIAATGGGEIPLNPLPRAADEARWLAQSLGAEVLLEGRATEMEVRRRLGRAPLVHFATHGYAYASEARAHDSFVALAPGEGHDGLLTVGDLLRDGGPELNAELVVLSACQTGLGDLKQAEGTVGLQRALLARGARSVLVSLWSISDAATELLMKRFYTHWLDGQDQPSKAEALRRAQEDVRATPGFAHPRFWAAFQLVGAP